MRSTTFLLGLAPWFLFSVVAERLGAGAVGYGAALACVGSLVLTGVSLRRGRPVVIEAAGAASFGVLTVASFLVSEAARQDIADYGRGGAAVVLALVMLVSAYTVPFTEAIARPRVDARWWGTPAFRALNRRMSLLWAGLIALMAASHLVAGALAASGTDRPLLSLGLNWFAPVLIVVRGLAMTQRMLDEGLRAESLSLETPVLGGAA
jgi:hypothetical protein